MPSAAGPASPSLSSASATSAATKGSNGSNASRGSRSYSGSGKGKSCFSKKCLLAWTIIPIIGTIACIAALGFSGEEPFSHRVRDNRDAKFYDGYANREDTDIVANGQYMTNNDATAAEPSPSTTTKTKHHAAKRRLKVKNRRRLD